MKKHTILLLIAAITGIATVKAQKGNNQLQIGAQINAPTGDLAEIAKVGYGFSAKGLFGFGVSPQQVTVEVGYNSFGVKDKYLSPGVSAQYRSWPIYTGYRYSIGKFYIEPQAGFAINTIYGSNRFNLASDTKAYFAWATGVGYSIKQFDFAVRYQASDVKNESSDITFAAFRVGYRLPFYKKSDQWK